MEMLKLLSVNELVSQIICFLIFLGIMRVFLWKRFLAILDKRSQTISSEFKKIDEEKDAASRIKSEYEAKLSSIDAEAKVIIRDATVRANKLSDEIRAKAQIDSEKIVENARFNIAEELTKAKENLKTTIVNLTIQVAEKVIQEKLSEDDDRRLVEDFIEGISKK